MNSQVFSGSSKPRLAMLAAMLASGVVFASGVNAAECFGASGDQKCIVIGSAMEPGSLNIIRDGDDGNELINWRINEPLVERDQEGNLVPILAAELPVVDEADPTVWHVKLREGITFTNGQKLTAETVKFNIDQVANPDFGATIAGIETLKTANVVDDYTLQIVTKAPDPWLLYRIATLRIVPQGDAATLDGYSQHPIGTGPYKFVRWDKGQRIVLEKNSNYWGGADAELDLVEFRFIPDAASRLAALQSGEVDMVGRLTTEETRKVPQVIRAKGAVNGSYLRFNLQTPPYDNVNLRKALALAINREAINQYLWDGEGVLEQCQILPSSEVGFNSSLSGHAYDPEKAKELLAQVDLPDGFAVQAYFTTGGYYPKDNEIGQAIAADWAAIGLKTDVQFISSDKWLDDVVGAGPKTTEQAPHPMVYVELDYHSMYAARVTSRIFDRKNIMSTLGDDYPELDTLMATAQGSFDVAEAAAAFEQVFKVGCDEVLYIPLIDYPDMWGAVENVKYTPGVGKISRLYLDRISVD